MGKKIESLGKFFKDFFAGIAYLEIEHTVRQEKNSRQRLFLLLTFGDLLGVPIFSRIIPCGFCLTSFPSLIHGKSGCSENGT